MKIIMNPKLDEEEIEKTRANIQEKKSEVKSLKRDVFYNTNIIKDISLIEHKKIATEIQEPFKRANRKLKPEDTVIEVNGSIIGGNHLGIIAGPCSIESEEQIVTVAKRVKESGANFLRGGAFKPRISPYSFQGLEIEGLKFLRTASKTRNRTSNSYRTYVN